jgi:hypothetical protein
LRSRFGKTPSPLRGDYRGVYDGKRRRGQLLGEDAELAVPKPTQIGLW